MNPERGGQPAQTTTRSKAMDEWNTEITLSLNELFEIQVMCNLRITELLGQLETLTEPDTVKLIKDDLRRVTNLRAICEESTNSAFGGK
jgi:hypothetical protein